MAIVRQYEKIFVKLNLTISNNLAKMAVKSKSKSGLSRKSSEQDIWKLAQIWENLKENSCPYHYNFHLHSTCSDGKLSPESIIKQAVSLGLKGLAITDHHNINGFYQGIKYLEKQQSNSSSETVFPHLWTGIEITSILNRTSVHILGYGFDPQSPYLSKYLTGKSPRGVLADAKKVIQALHQAGGLTVLAHPFRYRRDAQELILEAYELGIDGVEAYYAYGHSKPWEASSKQTLKAKQIASQYNLYTTCGTDTHGNNILLRV